MVSGLVTSPCDQLRIFSGDARLMRMASKSATGFAISNGLERNMFLRFPRLLRRRTRPLKKSLDAGAQSLAQSLTRSLKGDPASLVFQNFFLNFAWPAVG